MIMSVEIFQIFGFRAVLKCSETLTAELSDFQVEGKLCDLSIFVLRTSAINKRLSAFPSSRESINMYAYALIHCFLNLIILKIDAFCNPKSPKH